MGKSILKGGESKKESMKTKDKVVKNDDEKVEETATEETTEATEAPATTEAEEATEATEEAGETESTEETQEAEETEESENAEEETAEEGSEEAEENEAEADEAESEEGEKSEDAKADAGEKTEKEENHVELEAHDRLNKVEALLEKVADQLATIAKAQADVQSTASTEGAAETNEETLDKVEDTEEEEKVEDANESSTDEAETTEKSEKSEKADTSSEGANTDALMKSLDDFKKDVLKRIEELESRPAPSKAIVFTKSFDGVAEESTEELTKIENRLKEIDNIKKNKPSEYNSELIDEAFRLINKRDELKGE